MKLYSKGLTYIELLVVVALIVILTSIAVPSYTTMRTNAKKNICIVNLKQIEGAVEQWGLMNDVDEGIDLTANDDEIYEYLHGDRPKCPSGGMYTLTTLGQEPQVRCNVSGHEPL